MNPVPMIILADRATPAVWLLVASALLIAGIFYLLTLRGALGHISPEHRELEPSKVWLVMVPFFGLVWHFIVVIKLCRSLKSAFEAQELPVEDPGFSSGLGMAVCPLFCVTALALLFMPLVAAVVGVLFLVLWAIWWGKVAGYSRKLAA